MWNTIKTLGFFDALRGALLFPLFVVETYRFSKENPSQYILSAEERAKYADLHAFSIPNETD